MKTNLFAAAFGLTLLGVITISATSKNAAPVSQNQPALPAPTTSAPAAASIAGETPEIPFTFYLTLVTTFANGGSIDFDLVGEEGKSFFWNEKPKWGREQ